MPANGPNAVTRSRCTLSRPPAPRRAPRGASRCPSHLPAGGRRRREPPPRPHRRDPALARQRHPRPVDGRRSSSRSASSAAAVRTCSRNPQHSSRSLLLGDAPACSCPADGPDAGAKRRSSVCGNRARSRSIGSRGTHVVGQRHLAPGVLGGGERRVGEQVSRSPLSTASRRGHRRLDERRRGRRPSAPRSTSQEPLVWAASENE